MLEVQSRTFGKDKCPPGASHIKKESIKMKKFFVIILAIAVLMSITTAPCFASVATGYENLDIAIMRGIVKSDADGRYDAYATVTKGEVTDMFCKAYHINYAAGQNVDPAASEPATIDFIRMAYEATTGENLADAPLWRTVSTGNYVARIEAVNLIVQSLGLN